MADSPASSPIVVPAPPGLVEPHLGLLMVPPSGQLLYKVMKVEHLIDSIAGSYLHFNRVDGYPDLPGYDPNDGAQVPADLHINAGVGFARDPNFTAATYYNQCRARTYACCFGLKLTEHIWQTYANGAARGKIGVVFDFQRLRERLNANWASGRAQLHFGHAPIRQIFSINYGVVDYGVVDYVEWNQHRANDEHLPNPIKYTYLKARCFADEHELRVSLSALGIGHYAVGGTVMAFPATLQAHFDFRDAIADGGIREFIPGPDCDTAYLEAELSLLGIGAASTAPEAP